ncbi:MAG: deoxyribodipyrimidine photo-lyase, partial [Halobacteriales archaeon]|nr:deoxyribodipyrimidine photo-lyase [Halobacteriales archaeon]
MRLFWHRRDLRLADNVGLTHAIEAAEDGESLHPLAVIDPAILERAGPPRATFFLRSLAELQGAYRDHGSDLRVETGDPATVVAGIAEDEDVTGVHWNRDLSGYARRRDEAVSDALSSLDVDITADDDLLLHEPGSILTNAGDTYRVFSPFFDKWHDREKAAPHPEPESDRLASV